MSSQKGPLVASHAEPPVIPADDDDALGFTVVYVHLDDPRRPQARPTADALQEHLTEIGLDQHVRPRGAQTPEHAFRNLARHNGYWRSYDDPAGQGYVNLLVQAPDVIARPGPTDTDPDRDVLTYDVVRRLQFRATKQPVQDTVVAYLTLRSPTSDSPWAFILEPDTSALDSLSPDERSVIERELGFIKAEYVDATTLAPDGAIAQIVRQVLRTAGGIELGSNSTFYLPAGSREVLVALRRLIDRIPDHHLTITSTYDDVPTYLQVNAAVDYTLWQRAEDLATSVQRQLQDQRIPHKLAKLRRDLDALKHHTALHHAVLSPHIRADIDRVVAELRPALPATRERSAL